MATLQQMFIRVHRLEVQSVMLVFSMQLVNCCPLTTFSLVQLSPPPPLPCVNKYTAVYTYTVRKGGGGGLGLRQAELGICYILVRIRIWMPGSVPLTNGSDSFFQ